MEKPKQETEPTKELTEVGIEEKTVPQNIDPNITGINNAIQEQRKITNEVNRLDKLDEVREQLEMHPLMNADELPLSEIGKYIFEKRQKGEIISMRDNIKAGRDGVYRGEQIQGMTIKPDHAYRGVNEKTLREYVKTGSVEGSLSTPDVWSKDGGNKGVDWYLGGFAPKYGEIALETPADPESFVIADQENESLMANDPFVRHIKSEGGTNKSIPMSKVIAYRVQKEEDNGLLHAQKIDLDSFL